MSNSTQNQILTLSDNALKRIEQLKQKVGNDQPLRIYIVGGGCSGFQYGFEFADAESDDIVMPFGTTVVIVDPLSLQYLQGSTVDYIEDLHGAQFRVSNPHAETTCGCGSSFSLKEDQA